MIKAFISGDILLNVSQAEKQCAEKAQVCVSVRVEHIAQSDISLCLCSLLFHLKILENYTTAMNTDLLTICE